MRFGTAPGVLRVVFDLKTETEPQLFTLAPVAEFGHRLVLDLYPATPIDPLLALLGDSRNRAGTAVAAEDAPRPHLPASTDPAAPPRRRVTIALDPGHGGEDPGAIGPRGTREKHVALAIARKLKARLDAEPGMRAMLTRDDDYYVPLAARVHRARRVQADLFVSIHADAFRVPTARGASVFALSEHGATSAAAKWLAQKENAADLIGGVNLGERDPVLARTFIDMLHASQISDSLKAGRHVLDGIGRVNPLHRNAVEQAGFAVLKAPDIPSILVETAFISNPDEELMLRSDRHQRRLADSMHEGIRRYFAAVPACASSGTATG
jgi:N-acetylmuramoyl-L-alanine amidase